MFSNRLLSSFSNIFYSQIEINLYSSDITQVPADCIVNPTNSTFKLVGVGCDFAIQQGAGQEIQKKYVEYLSNYGYLELEKVFITNAFNLSNKFKYIFHVASPSKKQTEYMKILEKTYIELFVEFAKHPNFSSMSLPFIGTGRNQITYDECIKAFINSLKEVLTNGPISKSKKFIINFVDFNASQHTIQAFEQYFRGIGTKMSTQTQQAVAAANTNQSSINNVNNTGRSSSTKRQQSKDSNIDAQRDSKRASPNNESKDLASNSNEKAGESKKDSSDDDHCVICMDNITNEKKLEKCGHKFCKECIDGYFETTKKCPICGTAYGAIIGNQPLNATMTHSLIKTRLSGFETSNGTIQITYHIPSGTQGKEHPNPGQPYHGTTRIAYLPDNAEGREVLQLLKKAFDRRLVFTIGRSRTTGVDNVVTWNDIHHKTSMTGGQSSFGYPDQTYLSRVKEELASKGVV